MVKNKVNKDYENEKIIISFSKYTFSFRSCKAGKYTNYLSGDEEFHYYFKLIMRTIIPHLEQYTVKDLVSRKERHSHPIVSERIKPIVKELVQIEHGEGFDFELYWSHNINDYQVWQLGTSHGVRLICTSQKNIFNVLFIDYYHLISPDENFNQPDYSNYSFCPIENNGGGPNA